MSEDARKKILARRATFVAAALAGVACGKEPRESPQPCLSVPFIPAEASAPDAEPRPCLTPMPSPTEDAAPPKPCLSVVPRPAKDGGK
jgi:hypothetical protein